MGSIWPAWATVKNPVFRYETGRWRRSRLWRYLQPGVLGLALFLFVMFACLPTACVGLLAFEPRRYGQPDSSSPSAFVFFAGFVFVLASSLLSGLASWLLGLVSSALAATLIAREREAQAWPLVRLTLLTPAQIVGGKLTAFLSTLQSFMHLLAVWRGVTLAGGVAAFILFALLMPDVKSLLAELRSIPAFNNGLALAGLALTGLVGVGYWLIEPYFTVFYNGAVGLAVSTFARTRRWAIALVFITQFTLGLALYWPVQQMATFLPVGLIMFLSMSNPKNPVDPTLWTLPTIGLQYVVLFALQVIVLASCLALTVYRVESLND